MESKLHGSSTEMAPKVTLSSSSSSGIRAPITVDDDDDSGSDYIYSEYSAIPNTHEYSTSNSYTSGSEVENDEDFVSGEDEFETSSKRAFAADPDEGIVERTHFVQEYEISSPIERSPDEASVQKINVFSEYAFSRPIVKYPDRETDQESSSAAEIGHYRPIMKYPDSETDQKSSSAAEIGHSRPNVKSPNGGAGGESSRGSEYHYSASSSFSNDLDEEIVENVGNVVVSGDSRPLVAVPDEETLEHEKLPGMDVEVSLHPRLVMPKAQISADTDNDSLGSEDDGSSAAVIVRSNELLQRVNSAPKVRILEGEDEEEHGSLSEDIFDPEFSEELVYGKVATGVMVSNSEERVEDFVHDTVSVDVMEDALEDVKSRSLMSKECDSLEDLNSIEDVLNLSQEIHSNGEIPGGENRMTLDHSGEPTEQTSCLSEEGKAGELLWGNESLTLPAENALPHETADLNMQNFAEATEVENSSLFGVVSSNEVNGGISDMGLDGSIGLNQSMENKCEEGIVCEVASNSYVDAEENKCVNSLVEIDEMLSKDFIISSELLAAQSPGSCTDDHSSCDIKHLVVDEEPSITECSAYPPYSGSVFKQEISNKNHTVEELHKIDDSLLYDENDGGLALEHRFDSTEGESSRDHLPISDGHMISDSDDKVDFNGEDNEFQVFDALLQASPERSRASFTSADDTEVLALNPGNVTYSLKPDFQPSCCNFFAASKITINGEAEETLSEEKKQHLEDLKQIGVKYLQLVQRLGWSSEDSIPAQVLYQLLLAGKGLSSQPFSLESEEKNDHEFCMNILVIGKTGVGKSATINSIYREQKVVVNAFEPATSDVKEIVGVLDGVKIRIVDTPGLRTSIDDKFFNQRILSSIKKFIVQCPPDIILYVDRLDAQTRDLSDMHVLKSVSTCLGSSIWKNVVIALTHAASPPPDGTDGCPLKYGVHVARRSRFVKQLISHSAGDVLIPVALVENHPSVQRNQEGESLLPNGEIWRSKLLLVCYSKKILSEVCSVISHQDHRKLFGIRTSSSSLPDFSSSLLHGKSSTDQSAENVDSDVELDYLYDSDNEDDGDECEKLPVFKPLKNSQIDKLSSMRKEAYFDESDYREKDFLVGQEERGLGLCVMRRGDDFIWRCNIKSHFSVGRKSKFSFHAGLNNKLGGQISIRTSCSDQLQIAVLGLLPTVKYLFRIIFPHPQRITEHSAVNKMKRS